MLKSSKIKPFLWFDTQAEEAARFYASVFPNSGIVQVARRPKGVPGEEGKVMLVSFKLQGQDFLALNGGPQFPHTEAFSLLVECADQAEIDFFWDKLTSGGGKPLQCGWLKDRFGVFWQVVPQDLGRFFKDPKNAERVMAAVMQMVKLDIAAMEGATK
jgi:predicted 3-demethylubiquinone-9 3-methyltransferase (glyoxalase superfamily)